MVKWLLKENKKKGYIRYPEKIILQYSFGYGVYPLYILCTAVIVTSIFTIIFWLGNGLQNVNTFPEYMYFSFINAFKLGGIEYTPVSAFYQFLAVLEVIIGTFLWAMFIGTFARKFMR